MENNTSISNQTCNLTYNDTFPFRYSEPYQNLNLVLERYVHPPIYFVGITGNLLSLFIWTKPTMRNSCGCYFASLAIAETLVLLVHLPLTIDSVFQEVMLGSSTTCGVFSLFFTASESWTIFLLMAMTADRYIMACHPMKKHKYCTTKRTICVIASLGFLALLLGLVEGGFWNYDQERESCNTRVTSFRRAEGFRVDFLEVWNAVLILLVVIVPIGVIFVLNTVVAVALRQMKRRRENMVARVPRHHHHPSQPRGRPSRYDTEQTIILFYLSGYLVLSEAPDTIVYLLHPLFPHPDLYYSQGDHTLCETVQYSRSYIRFAFSSSVLGTFSLTNYAISIFIYSLSGRKFRKMLTRTLKKCWRRPPWADIRQPTIR